MDHIGMFLIGILSILGGAELVRHAWPEYGTEGCQHHTYDILAQPARLSMTAGIVLMVFGGVACYGGYCGWTVTRVLSVVMELANEYII